MRGYIPSIAFFGDSITTGMAPYLGDPCARAGISAVRVGVYSKDGSSARDWADANWVGELCERFRPNIVVIALGTNPEERDEREYAGLVSLLVDQAQRAGGTEAFFVGPFAYDDSGRRFRVAAPAAGVGHAISGYELAAGLPRAGEGNVHFTQAGYKALAERIVRIIRPAMFRAARHGRSLFAGGAVLAGGSIGIISGGWWVPVLLPFVPP